jgi:hypothetical protein
VASAPKFEALTTEEKLAPGEETSLVLRLTTDATAAAAADPTGEPVVEVTVRGARPPREVTKRTLSKDEIDHIPGTNGDALRWVAALDHDGAPIAATALIVVRFVR